MTLQEAIFQLSNPYDKFNKDIQALRICVLHILDSSKEKAWTPEETV